MESKSHFLAHFIPGILLGSVVGLAFGSLLVASQIPQAGKTEVARDNLVNEETTDDSSVAKTRIELPISSGPLTVDFKSGAQLGDNWGIHMYVSTLADWLKSQYDVSLPPKAVDGDLSLASDGRLTERLVEGVMECKNGDITDAERIQLSNAASAFVADAESGAAVYSYEFTPFPTSSEPQKTWLVTVLPNAPGFKSLAEFQASMNQCFLGGEANPMQISADWLAFSGFCGNDSIPDDPSLKLGCDTAKESLVLKLK